MSWKEIAFVMEVLSIVGMVVLTFNYNVDAKILTMAFWVLFIIAIIDFIYILVYALLKAYFKKTTDYTEDLRRLFEQNETLRDALKDKEKNVYNKKEEYCYHYVKSKIEK